MPTLAVGMRRFFLARISHHTEITDNGVFGGADIPVCQNRHVLPGRQECLPHRGEKCGLTVKFLRDEEAATAVEYSVMLGLILMVVFVAVAAVGSQTNGLWTSILGKLRALGIGL